MSDRGFTFIEILIAIAIFSLVAGIGYEILVSLESLQQENEILAQLLPVMQLDMHQWRKGDEVKSGTFLVNQVFVHRNIEPLSAVPSLERTSITYTWEIKNKNFSVHWQVDRFSK